MLSRDTFLLLLLFLTMAASLLTLRKDNVPGMDMGMPVTSSAFHQKVTAEIMADAIGFKVSRSAEVKSENEG